MNKTIALALVGLVTLSACGERSTPVTDTSATAPAGQKNVEDPATGTNTARPDSPKDLAPGTDGSTTPPAR